jgi:hypothetical protein
VNENTRRALAGLALPILGLAVVLVTASVTDVPDPLATHWALDGAPDDSMAAPLFQVAIVVLTALGGVAGLVASRRSTGGGGDLVAPVAIATFLQWVVVGVGVAVIVANDGAAVWTDAGSLSLPVALLVPLGAIAVATIAGRAVAPIGRTAGGRPGPRPTVDRTAGERLVWFAQVSSIWPVAVGGVIGVAGVVSLLLVGVLVGVVLIVVGTVVAMFATVRVTADRHGLTVRYGPFGWPRTRIGLDRIARAETIVVRPMEHGGWGYRGSITALGRAAVVVRAGEGIQLDLTDGTRFVVTVDDAETGAGAINDLVSAEQHPPHGP